MTLTSASVRLDYYSVLMVQVTLDIYSNIASLNALVIV